MHLAVHTHTDMKETPFCLVALVKSQNQLREGAGGLAPLKVLKRRLDKSTLAVPLLRAAEHLWRARFLLMGTTELYPVPGCHPAAAYYFLQAWLVGLNLKE